MYEKPNRSDTATATATCAERYFLGLDLGQQMDFSALVALRRRSTPDPERPGSLLHRFTARGIKRWPLKTPYPTVVADVVKIVSEPPLAGCLMGVDRTGCGQPVVDMLVQARPKAVIRPVLITAGHAVTSEPTCLHLPKRELVSAVSALLQSDRLDIPKDSPEAETLVKELLAFRAKISTAGNESFEADWRTKAHDDLVLALAMAAWLGLYAFEHTVPGELLLYPTLADIERLENEVVRRPTANPVKWPSPDDPIPAGHVRFGVHDVKIEDEDQAWGTY